jgi:hypothetical protein
MAHRKASKRSKARTMLRLADLEQSKNAVLHSLGAASSQESYGHAIDEFIGWYCSEPRLSFNRTVVLRYRFFLEQKILAPSTINVRLAAVRRLAYEASDTGLLSPDLAAGIRRVKGANRLGVRIGNWLTIDQSRTLLGKPSDSLRGKRDRAILALLIGCGLRRAELVGLRTGDFQVREDHSFDVSDGYNPVSNVIFDSAGNLYGTAKEGSELCHPPPRGCGAVFELIPGTNGKWTEKVVRSFYRGRFPLGGVIFDSAGNLYGTTEVGGRYKSGDCYEGGCGGTAFELSPGIDGKWTETTLHSFGKSGDGFTPTGSLIFDATGTEFRL